MAHAAAAAKEKDLEVSVAARQKEVTQFYLL